MSDVKVDKNDVQVILNRHFGEGKASVLFASIAGSRSFNLNLPESDADLFGVYVLHSDEVISSIPIGSKFHIITSHDPDYTLYEVHTFCQLVLKGNPKVIEPLFQSRLCYWEQGGLWDELIDMRSNFLTSTVIAQYVGFAKSQLHDSSRGKGNFSKKYYHALRLVHEAIRISNYQFPKVWLEGDEREYLMAIRRNEISSDVLDKELDDAFSILKSKLDDFNFIENFDKGKKEEDIKQLLNPWVIKLRRKSLSRPETPLYNDSNHPLYIIARNELDKNGIDGFILCCCLSGSSLHHGIQNSESLIDYIAVYACKTDVVLGLFDPIPRISPNTDSEIRDTYTRGLAIHELGNFCTLLQQENHRVMETLFSDNPNDYTTSIWNKIKENREKFITQVVTNHYQGVGRGQLVAAVDPKKKKGLMKKQLHHVVVNSSDIEDTKENRLKLYHALRLLSAGTEIVQNKTIPCILSKEYSDIIYGIRTGNTSIEEATRLSNNLCKQIEELKSELQSVPRRIEERYSQDLQDYLKLVRNQM